MVTNWSLIFAFVYLITASNNKKNPFLNEIFFGLDDAQHFDWMSVTWLLNEQKNFNFAFKYH